MGNIEKDLMRSTTEKAYEMAKESGNVVKSDPLYENIAKAEPTVIGNPSSRYDSAEQPVASRTILSVIINGSTYASVPINLNEEEFNLILNVRKL